jgi:hypothetical protein
MMADIENYDNDYYPDAGFIVNWYQVECMARGSVFKVEKPMH